MASKERRFFDALREVFVGAEVEGTSGFVNLMRMKSRYYTQGVFPRLTEEIDRALAPFPEFREELFDRLYTFFKRYFSESGSIYFRFTPPHEHVYEKVYTDDRDVVLFWKTHMLYYVKTDRLFRSMTVEIPPSPLEKGETRGFRFFFDVSALEHKRANEKRALVYAFKERREDGTLVFTVAYSERGRKTKLKEIRQAIKEALGLARYTSAVPSEETLERAFRLFERQSEVDFFINKNARRFLREQFNLWLYQYVFEPEEWQGTTWTERRIRQLQVLKEIAYKIIDFIAQFEDELVRIWNKPKFVLESHYVITLDRIAAQEGGKEVLARLFAHPGMEAQVQEWRDLGMVGEDFTPEQVWVEDLMGRRLHERYRHLPLDTQHFPDLETAILGLFDHLDQELDGRLVHSENYQALKTMLPKFQGRVKCVYIDPPYNSPSSKIPYKNDYRDSTWLTLMHDRLLISRKFLTADARYAIAIDDYEQHHLSELLDQITPDFERYVVVVNHHPQGGMSNNISRTHEYMFMLVPRGLDLLRGKEKKDKAEYRRFMLSGPGTNKSRTGRPNSFYAVLVDPTSGQVVGVEPPPPLGTNYPRERTKEGYERRYPISPTGEEKVWSRSYDSAQRLVSQGKIIISEHGTIKLKFDREGRRHVLMSNWTDSRYNAGPYGTALIADIIGYRDAFFYPKSLYTVYDAIEAMIWQEDNPIILDFFAGSGTTGHAVINLNREDGGRRRYILVEMADYFHTVLLPRIKKVAFSDKWKDGKAQEDSKGISHFVKYFRLEQYEEVLRKAHYRDDAPIFLQDSYTQYVFLRDPKMLDNAETGEEVMEVDLEGGEIRVALERLYPPSPPTPSPPFSKGGEGAGGSGGIDLAETLSCLTGKWIRRILPAEEDPTKPGRVEFEDGTTVDLQNPPWELIKPLIWW